LLPAKTTGFTASIPVYKIDRCGQVPPIAVRCELGKKLD
jgi:hypothetical protein